jgi:hypothetical protein
MHPQPTTITIVLSRIIAVTIVGSPGITSMSASSPGRTSRKESSGFRHGNQGKKPMVQVKHGKLNFTTLVDVQREQHC